MNIFIGHRNSSRPIKFIALAMVATTLGLNGCSGANQGARNAQAKPTQFNSANNQYQNRAVAHRAQPRTATSSVTGNPGVINPKDTLNVTVFKVPDLSVDGLTVESNGMISLPLIGSTKVAGMSVSQAEKTIQGKLSKYMKSPKVSLVRTNNTAQVDERVTVEGAVNSPGVFPVKGETTLLQAIALSRGLTNLADTKQVIIYRGNQSRRVDIDQVRTGQFPDPLLANNDRIVVLESAQKKKKEEVKEMLPVILSPLQLFM